MRPGSLVKLTIPDMDNADKKGSVEKGALARVVNGYDEFPYLHKKLVDMIGDQAEEFLWVKWDKRDPRWHGRVDGAYHSCRFCDAKRKMIINTNKVLN